MGLATTIDGLLSYILTNPSVPGNPTARFDGIDSITLDDGTGANQADRVYHTSITLAASANQDVDLSGTLTNQIGGTAVFAKVKAILVRARAANTNNVIVGGAPANGFVGPFGAATHTLAVKPGGEILLVDPGTGWTVTPATGDLLRVANSGAGTSVTLDLIVIGTSA